MEESPEINLAESKEKKDPEIDLTIYYSAHRTIEDLRGLEELLREADVYAVEMTDWEESTKDHYNQVSSGQMTPQEFFEREPSTVDDLKKKELEILYKSEKPILFVDLPAIVRKKFLFFEFIRKNPLSKDFEEVQKKAYEPMEFFHAGRFDDAIESEKKRIRENGKLNNQRESFIRNQLEEQLEELKNDPSKKDDFSKREKIKVLMRMGALHTNIFHQIRAEGKIKVRREFGHKPFIFPNFDEAVRSYVFNKEIKNETVARALTDHVLFSIFFINYEFSNSQDIDLLLRKISSKLSYNQIKEISTRMGEGEKFIPLMRSFGVSLPRNIEEMKAILGDQMRGSIKKRTYEQ